MSNGGVDTMLGIIPVVVVGGLLMKFTEAIMPTRQRVLGGKPKKKQSIYSRKYSGNFSNVGY